MIYGIKPHHTCDRKIKMRCDDDFGQITPYTTMIKINKNYTVNTPSPNSNHADTIDWHEYEFLAKARHILGNFLCRFYLKMLQG